MICCNSAFEHGNLDLWRYINAFIIIIIMCVASTFKQFLVTVINVSTSYVVISQMNDNIEKLLIFNYVITCSRCYLLSNH